MSTAYGISFANAGSIGRWVTVQVNTRPRPDVGSHVHALDPQTPHR